jgi:putative component of toxin-antitoxin plasmid stabilization module
VSEHPGKRIPAIFYRTEAGGEPVREWLKGLPSREDRRRIGYDIETVEFGWPVGMPACRPLGDGIHEVRTDLAENRIARVLFYIDKKGRAWCFYTDSSRSPNARPRPILNWRAPTKRSTRKDWYEEKIAQSNRP